MKHFGSRSAFWSVLDIATNGKLTELQIWRWKFPTWNFLTLKQLARENEKGAAQRWSDLQNQWKVFIEAQFISPRKCIASSVRRHPFNANNRATSNEAAPLARNPLEDERLLARATLLIRVTCIMIYFRSGNVFVRFFRVFLSSSPENFPESSLEEFERMWAMSAEHYEHQKSSRTSSQTGTWWANCVFDASVWTSLIIGRYHQLQCGWKVILRLFSLGWQCDHDIFQIFTHCECPGGGAPCSIRL